MVPSQFLSVVLEEANNSESEEENQTYNFNPKLWQNQYAVSSNNTISDQEMWNLTKNLPKALLAECTVEISRTPINENESSKKPCFDARVSPVFSRSQPPTAVPSMTVVGPLQQFLPPPPQLIHRSEWIEESMDVQDLLTGVEAVYSDNESDGEFEEAASVSIFPITVSSNIEKNKPEKIKKQDINKFSYPCDHCPNVYSNRGALWQHSVATHSVEKTCECKICGRKFYRNCSLALHLKSHSEEEFCQCKECGKSFNRLANLERHMRVHVDCEQFPCPHCDKIFRDKDNLMRHIIVHTAPTIFKCEICYKSYKSQELLEVHYQNSHSQMETSLACPTCGDVFKSIPELMKHATTHLADAVLLCKFCGLSFQDKNALKQHMLSHGERLSCPCCGIDFTQKSSLLRHIKRMHPKESEDIIDPSLLLDDKNSGHDSSREGSDNGSVQDGVDQENETENEMNSTVEIRKALGAPIKFGGLTIIAQPKIINNVGLTLVKSSNENTPNCLIAFGNVILNNNSTGNKPIVKELPEAINSSESSAVEETKDTDMTKKVNGESHMNQDEQDDIARSKIEENGCDGNSSESEASKEEVKDSITDPLTSIGAKTMQASALKLQT